MEVCQRLSNARDRRPFASGGSLPDKSRYRGRDEIAARESGIFPHTRERRNTTAYAIWNGALVASAHWHRPSQSSLQSRSPKKTILTGLGSRLHRAFVIDVDICDVAKIAISSVPAVIFGALLNILDGLPYGMIMFHASGVFTSLGGMGISLFLFQYGH
ncbi:hypothetical protein BKA82DRAFT_2403335 [Pisolithus tinctorius]|nr:hypothetical protein BKA82DRAFT_2403335 [Pisolithus tinctorius]